MYKKGFTLIELLIVIAILGVLAVVVLVAINPVQQLARTRDGGRKSTTLQLGHAVQAYYTARNSEYPSADATWISYLTSGGEMASIPAPIVASVAGYSACTTNSQSSYCYASDTEGTLVYTVLESEVERSKCASGDPYFTYSAVEGRGGLICAASEPTPAAEMDWNATQ